MKKLLIPLTLLSIVLLSGCVGQTGLENVGMKPTTTTTFSENKIIIPTKEFTSIEEINNNPDNFENKSVKVNGLFIVIVGYGLEDNTCSIIGLADYKLVDSQGLQLFIYAPNRDLSQYNGQTITVEGVVKPTYDSKTNFNPYSVTCYKSGYYLEFSRIS